MVRLERVENVHDFVAGRFRLSMPLTNSDGMSSSFRSDDVVVKVRPCSPFEAEHLVGCFTSLNRHLVPLLLAPKVRRTLHDGTTFATVFDFVEGTAQMSDLGAVGTALGRAHVALQGHTTRTLPWTGNFGERFEFKRLLDAMPHGELRDAGLNLVTRVNRSEPPGPVTLVHRDAHPRNVVWRAPGCPVFLDWDLAHTGSAIDDLAMTALMWATDVPRGDPLKAVSTIVNGYRSVAGSFQFTEDDFWDAFAIAGLRQGIAGWYTDEGDTSAVYWPFVRNRTLMAANMISLRCR